VSGATTDDAMTRSEDELRVGTERRETGRARLRKYVETENVQQTVPVRQEEARVAREPITDANIEQAMSGPDISESEHEVALHTEEPVVEKRTVPKERVRLDKDVHTEEETVSGSARSTSKATARPRAGCSVGRPLQKAVSANDPGTLGSSAVRPGPCASIRSTPLGVDSPLLDFFRHVPARHAMLDRRMTESPRTDQLADSHSEAASLWSCPARTSKRCYWRSMRRSHSWIGYAPRSGRPPPSARRTASPPAPRAATLCSV
jgi:hypothetical protein